MATSAWATVGTAMLTASMPVGSSRGSVTARQPTSPRDLLGPFAADVRDADQLGLLQIAEDPRVHAPQVTDADDGHSKRPGAHGIVLPSRMRSAPSRANSSRRLSRKRPFSPISVFVIDWIRCFTSSPE